MNRGRARWLRPLVIAAAVLALGVPAADASAAPLYSWKDAGRDSDYHRRGGTWALAMSFGYLAALKENPPLFSRVLIRADRGRVTFQVESHCYAVDEPALDWTVKAKRRHFWNPRRRTQRWILETQPEGITCDYTVDVTGPNGLLVVRLQDAYFTD